MTHPYFPRPNQIRERDYPKGGKSEKNKEKLNEEDSKI